MQCDAHLAATCLFTFTSFGGRIFTRKVGLSDLVCCLQSGFTGLCKTTSLCVQCHAG